MKKMIWITSLIVLFATLILPGILVVFVKFLPSGAQPPLGNTIGVYEKNEIVQQFISTKDNLSGIAMTIKNPDFRNKQNIYLTVYDENSIQVAQSKLNGANIADGDFVKFVFDPIGSSLNKKYKFVLSSPDSNNSDQFPVFFTDTSAPWANGLSYLGEDVQGSVSFITLHVPTSKISLIGGMYSNLFGRFLTFR